MILKIHEIISGLLREFNIKGDTPYLKRSWDSFCLFFSYENKEGEIKVGQIDIISIIKKNNEYDILIVNRANNKKATIKMQEYQPLDTLLSWSGFSLNDKNKGYKYAELWKENFSSKQEICLIKVPIMENDVWVHDNYTELYPYA
ncbi:MAG: hypothetical protein ACOCQR_01265 [bacterium]